MEGNKEKRDRDTETHTQIPRRRFPGVTASWRVRPRGAASGTALKVGLRPGADPITPRGPESGRAGSVGDVSPRGLCGPHAGLGGTKGPPGTGRGPTDWTSRYTPFIGGVAPRELSPAARGAAARPASVWDCGLGAEDQLGLEALA